MKRRMGRRQYLEGLFSVAFASVIWTITWSYFPPEKNHGWFTESFLYFLAAITIPVSYAAGNLVGWLVAKFYRIPDPRKENTDSR